MASTKETLEREIARLRRRYHHLLGEAVESLEAPCLWDVTAEALCWKVFLDEVLEPDVDVEFLAEAIVVRGETAARRLKQALLPVPTPFNPRRARIRFVAGVLEIRVQTETAHDR